MPRARRAVTQGAFTRSSSRSSTPRSWSPTSPHSACATSVRTGSKNSPRSEPARHRCRRRARPRRGRWHFIGQVQTKKARAVARHPMPCTPSTATASPTRCTPCRSGGRAPRCVRADQPHRRPRARGSGSRRAARLAEHIAAVCPSLRLRGVMASPRSAGVPPRRSPGSPNPPRPFAPWCRMPLGSRRACRDFAEAIGAGATHLRIGTAITGARPAHG